MLAQAFILGGHCRIGMEDTVHLARGKPTPSNAVLVEKSVRIIQPVAIGSRPPPDINFQDLVPRE
jgi:uncharacterized protein (DUF849 family)